MNLNLYHIDNINTHKYIKTKISCFIKQLYYPVYQLEIGIFQDLKKNLLT